MPFTHLVDSTRLRAGVARAETPPAVEAPPAREHGGLAEGPFAPRDPQVLDFSVNINPFGPAPAVLAAVRAARMDVYPDPTAREAREALARRTGSHPGQIVLGNGAAELLWTLAAAILSPGDAALVVEPSFSEFAAAARQRGARVGEWRATWEGGFAVRLDAVAEAVGRTQARAVYLCSPGNPAGVHTPLAGISALARRFPEVVFVLDQAFLGLSEHHGELAAVPPENVVRVRSLTKDHGIPGIRVGYLLTTVELAARVERARPPWTTSTAAQAAAIAACGAEDFVAASRDRLLGLRARLEARLAGLGLPVAPSCTVFCLARVGDSAALKRRLLDSHGILTRDCTSFGLPGWLRLAARPEPDQTQLIEALRRELER